MFQFLISFFLGSILSGNLALAVNDSLVNFNPVRDYTSQSVGVDITAKAALVVDKETNQILYSKNPDQVMPIASITKLLTALVFLETNPDWQTKVTMQPNDEVYRAKYVYRGEIWSIKDLFWTMLIGSDNNATMALVRSTGLSTTEFVSRMNQKAQVLGMKNSNFFDPTGLSEKNIASATDIWLLAKSGWQHELIMQPASQTGYNLSVGNSSNTRRVINTNLLLGSFLDIKAGKTGFIDEAGYCLTTLVTNQQAKEIFLVVLGSTTEADRWQDAKALAWWTFNNWLWP
jgi:D-alanyl-D-alanine endopeptidase (penicillin-binding protein 7)